MELEDDGGSARIFVGPGSRTTELGRGRGFASADRSVSRRHVSFHLAEVDGGEARVSFDVLGKNPVVVVFNGGTKKLFRKGQVGELAPGDRLSLSLKRPVFFSLKCLNDFGEFESRFLSSNQSPIEGLALDSARLAFGEFLNPISIAEFGFLERGHEFDRFLGRIREPGAWNWFLEEEEEMKMNSDSEEEATKRKKKRGRKEKGRGEEDEDWTGESEEEKTEAAMAGGSGRRSRYLTRSGKTWQSSLMKIVLEQGDSEKTTTRMMRPWAASSLEKWLAKKKKKKKKLKKKRKKKSLRKKMTMMTELYTDSGRESCFSDSRKK